MERPTLITLLLPKGLIAILNITAICLNVGVPVLWIMAARDLGQTEADPVYGEIAVLCGILVAVGFLNFVCAAFSWEEQKQWPNWIAVLTSAFWIYLPARIFWRMLTDTDPWIDSTADAMTTALLGLLLMGNLATGIRHFFLSRERYRIKLHELQEIEATLRHLEEG